MTEKNCPKCGIVKPLIDFRPRSGRNGVLQSYCKACERNYWRYGKNRVWIRRWANLKRHGPCDLSPAQLRDALGEPETCYLCGTEIADEAELDHVLPLIQGGGATIDNLKWTHRQCNRMKHDMTTDELKTLMRKILANLP